MANFPHHRLIVYQKTLEIIRDIDPLIAEWPYDRRYLGYQARRSFSSIGLNISEASYEPSTGDMRRLFRYARRSAGESVGNLDQALLFRLNSESQLAGFYDRLAEVIAMLTPLTKGSHPDSRGKK